MNAIRRKWLAGACAALCMMLAGCDVGTAQTMSPAGPTEPAIAADDSYCLKETQDDAQIKAYMGDLLYTDRYDRAVPEELKRKYAWTDIGAPIVFARTNDGGGILYMPLLSRGRQVATGSLTLSQGWIRFRDIREDAQAEAMFAVTRNAMENRLQREGRHLQSMSFLLDPTLFGDDHTDDMPLCEVRTDEGDRLYYLYRDDVFLLASDLAKRAMLARRGTR